MGCVDGENTHILSSRRVNGHLQKVYASSIEICGDPEDIHRSYPKFFSTFVRKKDAEGIWKLYDRVNHTFEYPDDDYFYVNKVRLLPFEDIPAPFQRYIVYKSPTEFSNMLNSIGCTCGSQQKDHIQVFSYF